MVKRGGLFFCAMLVLVASFFFVLADFVDDGTAVQNVTSCGVLNTPYAVYTLNQSIDSGEDGDCLTIANESIVLDCAGYNITFGNATNGWGISVIDETGGIGFDNVTIKNCVLIQNNPGAGWGFSGVSDNVTTKNCVFIQNNPGADDSSAIFFGANSTNATVYNNTITVQENETFGISFEGDSMNANISVNNITTSGLENYGILLGARGNGASIESNIIITSTNDSSGIIIGDNSTNGTVYNNTITTLGNFSFTGDSAFGAIFLEVGTNNMNVSLNNITTSGIGGEGMWIWGSNSTIENNNITASGEWGDGIYLNDVQGMNLTSNTINVSGNASYGIYSLMSEDSSNLFYRNVITTSANHSDGIHLEQDNYNNMSSNNITTSGNDSFGIYFNESYNATISNNIIKTGKTDSYVLYLLDSSGNNFYNNIFNTSTSGSGVNFTSCDASYFNTTNDSTTNIVGKDFFGGNFWTNALGTGYSDLCANTNGDYFCDSVYNIINSSNDNKDYLALTTHIGWNFNGTVMDTNGTVLNNSVINITLWAMGVHGPSLLGSNSSNSSATGLFNLIVHSNSSYMYKPVITHTNTTYDFVDYVGQTLPMFPYSEFSSLSNINFYLKPAGTINITTINSTGDLIPFGYMIKDMKLGYEVSMNTNTSSSGAVVYVPKDRNYSIMVWPADGDSNHFVPVSYEWNNFTSSTNYTFGLSSYNATTRTLDKQFNVTESFSWVSGYINKSDIAGWDNITIVPYLLEPSDMVGMTRGGLPYNASAWRGGGATDNYSLSDGFYNITLPYSSTETVRYLLLAVAENSSTYYGSYRNLTVDNLTEELNFTMFSFLGNTSAIVNMSDSMGGNNHIVNISKQGFNLVNVSNQTQVLSNISAHTEITVDYSDYNCTEFTFIEDLSGSGGDATIYLPLLSMSNDEGIKEINVYSQTYAPKRVGQKSGTDMQNTLNVSMGVFSPSGAGNDNVEESDINFTAYLSNATCDVPNPPASCVLTSFAPTQEAGMTHMFPLVIGGGDLSVRVTFNNISIHYVGVDLLASGPPDMEFNNQTDEGTSGSFSSAMKFGSQGPTIYDYVLVSVPYTKGSSSVAGLNESAEVNMSIPYLYSSNSWSSPIWDTSLNGTNGTLLAGNYSHYSTYSSEWATLMGNNTCGTNVSEFNATNPCYINTTSNRIWVQLPHFSGTEPSITGSATTVTTTSSDDSSSSDGGGGNLTYHPTEEKLLEGYTLILRKDYKVKFDVSNESYTLNVDSIGKDSVQITVSSESQMKTLSVGDEVKFELDGDDVYDFSVKLESIGGSSAKLLMKRIFDEVSDGGVGTGNGSASASDSADGVGESNVETGGTGNFWIWFGVVVFILVIVVGVIVFRRNK